MTLDVTYDLALRNKLDRPLALASAEKIEALRQALRALEGSSRLKKILWPMIGPGKLTIDEALYYRLYQSDLNDQEIRRFVGRRMYQKFHHLCNDASWFAAAHDKALFYTIICGAGLPIPQTHAISGERRRAGYMRFLADAKEVTTFLLANRHWPIFAKPVDGIYGIGALKIVGLDERGLELFGGAVHTADSIAAYMAALTTAGYLFQDCLLPSRFAAKVVGEIVPSIRFLILLSGAAPVIESAVIKIPVGNHVTDNYWHGQTMLGAVSVATGAIERVVTGFGTTLCEHRTHPVTGHPLIDLVIPEWRDACAIVREAATLFPGVRTQSWDVALSEEGPVLLEFNYGGDLNLHQLAHRRGALSDSYIEHLRRCGYKGRLL